MVSNKMLLNIHKRLREIFECIEANIFVGKTGFILRDLLQLLPIKSQQVFAPLGSLFGNVCNPWSIFFNL